MCIYHFNLVEKLNCVKMEIDNLCMNRFVNEMVFFFRIIKHIMIIIISKYNDLQDYHPLFITT